MAQSLVVSQEEMDKQRQCAARVREGFPGRTYKIVTYGCQMNAHDSENLAGMLEEMGFAPAADEGEADLLLFNTCCIRDNAERRLLGNVSALAQRKREKPDLLVGVCGCMMQQEGGAQRLLDLCPFVDLVFGTHNLYRLPELLLRHYQAGTVSVPLKPAQYRTLGIGVPRQAAASPAVQNFMGYVRAYVEKTGQNGAMPALAADTRES